MKNSLANIFITTLISSTLLAQFSRISPKFLTPGFSPLVLFSDPIYVITTVVALTCILSLSIYHLSKFQATVLVVCFSTLFLNFWQLNIPGGTVIGESYTHASIAQSILQSEHLLLSNYGGWGAYPSTYEISVFMSNLTGLGIVNGINILDLVYPSIFALFGFFLVNQFLNSPRDAAIATMLAIIADEYIGKLSFFQPAAYGIVFYFVSILILYRLIDRKGKYSVIGFIVVAAASIITYPEVGFVLSLTIPFVLLARKKVGTITALLVPTLTFSTWSLFTSGFYSDMLYELKIVLSLRPSSGITSSLTGNGPFYLFQLLGSNISALPFHLGLLLPFWFLVLYVLGTFLWVASFFKDRNRVKPESFIMLPLYLTGFALYVLPGGAEWNRILPLMGFFLSPLVFSLIVGSSTRVLRHIGLVLKRQSSKESSSLLPVTQTNSVSSYGHAFVVVLLCLLMLPTLAEYGVGQNTASYYQWSYSTGNFLATRDVQSTVYNILDTPTYNYTIDEHSTSLISLGAGLSPDSALGLLESGVRGFDATRGNLLVIDPTFYVRFSHLYGNTSTKIAIAAVTAISTRVNLVYSTGYSNVYYSI